MKAHSRPKEIGGLGRSFFSACLTDPKLQRPAWRAIFDFRLVMAPSPSRTWLIDGKRPRLMTAVTPAHQAPECLSARVDDEATIILTIPHAPSPISAGLPWNWPFSAKRYGSVRAEGDAITVCP